MTRKIPRPEISAARVRLWLAPQRQALARPTWDIPTLGFQPALDGIRAFAVLAVLARHGGYGAYPGGFLGVDVFFVLSGFLITSLLLEEWSKSGRIALGAFYGRRARRLLPALFVTLFGVGLLYLAVPSLERGIGYVRSAFFVTFYSGNWVAGGDPGIGILEHTWSLAIEEQFYIVWPALVIIALTLHARPVTLLTVVLALAATSVGMRWLTTLGLFPGSSYFSTYNHADGLLIGCAVAVARGMSPLRAVLLHIGSKTPVALGAFLFLLLIPIFVDYSMSVTYFAVLSGAAIASAVLINHAISAPTSPITASLASRVSQWIGRRSYGLYLYHVPVFSLLTPERVDLDRVSLLGLRVAVTVAVAALSFRFIEVRFLKRKRYPGGAPSRMHLPKEEREPLRTRL